MSGSNALSITRETDAIASGMHTDSDGIIAFRLGGPEAVRAIEELGGVEMVGIGDVVSRAMSSLSESEQVERLKETHPDEFEIGVAVYAYKARKARV